MKAFIWFAAIVYGISPVDFVPDIAPPVIYADDAVVLILAAIINNWLRKRGK